MIVVQREWAGKGYGVTYLTLARYLAKFIRYTDELQNNNAIHYNTSIFPVTIRYNTLKYVTIRYNTIQYVTLR